MGSIENAVKRRMKTNVHLILHTTDLCRQLSGVHCICCKVDTSPNVGIQCACRSVVPSISTMLAVIKRHGPPPHHCPPTNPSQPTAHHTLYHYQSGKDRTSMGVTLEEARHLCDHMSVVGGRKACKTIRRFGGRRSNGELG